MTFQQEDTGLNLDPEPGFVKDTMEREYLLYKRSIDRREGYLESLVGTQWFD